MKRRLAALSAVLAALVAYPVLVAKGGGVGDPTYVFELSMKGKTWQTAVILNPGVKPPIGNVKNKDISDVLTGALPDFAEDYLDLDPGGKFYLYYDGRSSWRVATNPNGADLTTLNGQVANDGVFWLAGHYDMFLADADVFVQGKVTFEKNSFVPKKVKGKFLFVSEALGTGMTLSFKTVGAPTILP